MSIECWCAAHSRRNLPTPPSTPQADGAQTPLSQRWQYQALGYRQCCKATAVPIECVGTPKRQGCGDKGSTRGPANTHAYTNKQLHATRCRTQPLTRSGQGDLKEGGNYFLEAVATASSLSLASSLAFFLLLIPDFFVPSSVSAGQQQHKHTRQHDEKQGANGQAPSVSGVVRVCSNLQTCFRLESLLTARW